ncbi:DMP19 family protein [Kribbella sp. NBC_01505]|uniref:DMP19 family protein n=1 Tax=Kribbella sp. NBC_01505 TaxID=2903580 RepID=UPI003870100C
MDVYNRRLQDVGQLAEAFLEAPAPDLRDLADLTVMAASFDYQVKNGGFAQLFFNGGYDLLEPYEVMLHTVDAERTAAFYVRAITLCADHADDFHLVMATFTHPCQLNIDLLMLSMEYLRENHFDTEVARFLEYAEATFANVPLPGVEPGTEPSESPT